jgi:translation initiation factor IF-1
MKKDDVIIVEGEVVENLPNTLFRVKLIIDGQTKDAEDKIIICYLSGKMRKNYIKILPGDKVRIELTPYDLERGRIIYRK